MTQVDPADYIFGGVTGVCDLVYEDARADIGPVLIDKAFRVSARTVL
jgi:hypothetical protein